MRSFRSVPIFAVLILTGALGVSAQDRVHVRITSNLPEAAILADSVMVGHAGDGLVAVPVSTRRLRAVARQRDTWSIPPVEGALEAAAGDTVSVDLSFPHYYSIDSEPFGADVFLEHDGGRIRLGETPLVHRSERPLEGQLVIEQPGFMPQRVMPGSHVWNDLAVVLDARSDLQASRAEVPWHPPRRTRRWIDVAALGTAVAAGAVAVHYKFKADRRYEEYERTTDPALRSDIDRYDAYSGVALGTMQVGLGVFAVRLVLR